MGDTADACGQGKAWKIINTRKSGFAEVFNMTQYLKTNMTQYIKRCAIRKLLCVHVTGGRSDGA